MCNTNNNTPSWYQQQAYVNSSLTGMADQMYGTVDIQVGEKYCTRNPVKAIHLFAVDCSDVNTLDVGRKGEGQPWECGRCWFVLSCGCKAAYHLLPLF